MNRFSHYKNAPYPLEKIYHLYKLLKAGAKQYEAFIKSRDNIKMQDILHRLTLTNDQFACELYSRIHSFAEIPGLEAEDKEPGIAQQIVNGEHTPVDFFIAMEKLMVDAYRDVLNQPFFDAAFRQMINFQLNEMLFLFMHLKLMHSLKVKMY